MKRLALLLALVFVAVSLAPAAVVRLAPDVQWLDANGARQNLSKFKGQPVILLIAPSPMDRSFRSQVGQLQKMYQRFAADKVVCLAAFTAEPGLIKSNIPFAVIADGPRAAYDYQVEKFAIAFIGRDGNLDYVTNRVVPAQRVYDLIGNSFVAQEALRKH